MGLPKGWEKTAGSPAVTVGVADTGLDLTHAELASEVTQVIDLTVLQGDEPICRTLFGQSDEDLAAQFGASPPTASSPSRGPRWRRRTRPRRWR